MTGLSLVADMSRSSGLVGLIDLGEQVTLGSPGGGLIAAPAAQDEGDADGEHGASDRPRDVDPVAGEGGADQVGSEGAGRVHRGARDGAAPQAGQGDVAADPEGADDADVLGARGGAQDHADQARGQDELHPERGPGGVAAGGVVGPVGGGDADDGVQDQGGERRAGQLHDDVAGDPAPGEVAAQREGDADGRVQVGAGDLAHEQD